MVAASSSPPGAPSLMSESRWRDQAWATRNGPGSRAATSGKAAASTSRTPAASGSMPRAAQARSRKERAGTTVTSTRSSARSSSTVRSATVGEPGTA